ncbi:MAG TPA: fluoride efflux transporter CrcB [Acidimicrobiales bacterium]|nr:fluoride efflux transporter CrcB [Acidimicrobiales bacterium]
MPAAPRTPVELVPAPGPRIIAIAAGGALGTLARYGVERAVAVSTDGFPWATFVVNVAGSFLLGVILTLVTERWAPTRYVRPFAVIGFCGGFTTFSTFTVEAVRRVQDGHPAVAIIYLLTSLVAGMAAVGLGVLVARGGRVEPDHLLSADPDADPGVGG